MTEENRRILDAISMGPGLVINVREKDNDNCIQYFYYQASEITWPNNGYHQNKRTRLSEPQSDSEKKVKNAPDIWKIYGTL